MRTVTLTSEAPGDGQPLFVHFVNTLHWDAGDPIELIGTDPDFAAWLAEHHLPAADVTGGLSAVHLLRTHLRGMTDALASGRTPDAVDTAALNAALAAAPGQLVLVGAEPTRPQLAFGTAASDAALFVFRLALSFATFQDSHNRNRLKLCANPGCGFAFVDTSINRTRRWCDMRYCGNRSKVRQFRQRGRREVFALS